MQLNFTTLDHAKALLASSSQHQIMGMPCYLLHFTTPVYGKALLTSSLHKQDYGKNLLTSSFHNTSVWESLTNVFISQHNIMDYPCVETDQPTINKEVPG